MTPGAICEFRSTRALRTPTPLRPHRIGRSARGDHPRGPHGAGERPILLARMSERVRGLDHQTTPWTGRTVGGFIKDGSIGYVATTMGSDRDDPGALVTIE